MSPRKAGRLPDDLLRRGRGGQVFGLTCAERDGHWRGTLTLPRLDVGRVQEIIGRDQVTISRGVMSQDIEDTANLR